MYFWSHNRSGYMNRLADLLGTQNRQGFAFFNLWLSGDSGVASMLAQPEEQKAWCISAWKVPWARPRKGTSTNPPLATTQPHGGTQSHGLLEYVVSVCSAFPVLHYGEGRAQVWDGRGDSRLSLSQRGTVSNFQPVGNSLLFYCVFFINTEVDMYFYKFLRHL